MLFNNHDGLHQKIDEHKEGTVLGPSRAALQVRILVRTANEHTRGHDDLTGQVSSQGFNRRGRNTIEESLYMEQTMSLVRYAKKYQAY